MQTYGIDFFIPNIENIKNDILKKYEAPIILINKVLSVYTQ